MQQFNVLDRRQNIHRSYVIEASAGTGKTYSIENIVVRLLIDASAPCTLDEILLVTFTRAATDDLKMRIRGSLVKSLCYLRQALRNDEGVPVAGMPDYLAAIVEERAEKVMTAVRAIENALSTFQQASIFTIHSFCHRMLREYLLEGDVSLTLGLEEEGLPPVKIYGVIKDFFRTDLNESLLSSEQLQRLLDTYKSVDKLEKELFELITKRIDIAEGPNLESLLGQFCSGMHALQQIQPIDPKLLVEDFKLQAPSYKNICNRKNQPKPEYYRIVERFAALFYKQEWGLKDFDVLVHDGVYLANKLAPENLKSKVKPLESEKLHYPQLIERLRSHLSETVSAAQNPALILATLAQRCRKMLREHLEQEEMMGFDDLLERMHQAVDNPLFVKKIQARFMAAIIDEFQDTDPIQWEIFKTLFDGQKHLYLVGDPKQSIYGFRQADIYTYISAKRHIGDDSIASLGVNYRSSPLLVDALNAIFNPADLPQLLSLPHIGEVLDYQPVESGGLTPTKKFSDGHGCVQFFSIESTKENQQSKSLQVLEEGSYFPFITAEILRLNRLDGCNFGDMAILVGDRFQAQRIGNFLARFGIPIVAQHSSSLADTLMFPAFRELLLGVLSPRNESVFKRALGGPIIGWTHLDLLNMNEMAVWEATLAKCLELRKVWMEQGFAPFFQALSQSRWVGSGPTIVESLLSRQGGIDLYHDLQQLAELLIEEEARHQVSPHKLIDYFDSIEKLSHTEGKAILRRGNPDKMGVNILTIHSSKGLEFEIVFALGVIKRLKSPAKLIPVFQTDGSSRLEAVTDPSDCRYVRHAMEMDAEKIRQLYVAFTRAKQRLYIPLLCGDATGACELGSASPLELYLARIGWNEPSLERLYQQIPHPHPKAIFDFIETLSQKHSVGLTKLRDWEKRNAAFSVERGALDVMTDDEGIVYSISEETGVQDKASQLAESAAVIFAQSLNEMKIDLSPIEIKQDVVLKPPSQVQIAGSLEYMHSFSSLGGTGRRAHAEAIGKAPNDFSHPEPSMHNLPAGIDAGILLHAILETVPFHLALQGPRNPQLMAHVIKAVQHTSFKNWGGSICDMVFNALTAKLPLYGDFFSLVEVSPSLCYQEHEFIYSSSERDGVYIKGVIDLIFQHKDKYCIVDWKSNWLGPNVEDYTTANSQIAMQEYNYYLQADLYKQALMRYLLLCEPRPFEEVFGGIYYLFLRGLSPGTDQGVVVL